MSGPGPGAALALGPVVMPAAQIAARVRELGAELAAAYAGRDLVLVASLKAGAVLLADLSRATPIPHALDTVEVQRFDAAAGAAPGAPAPSSGAAARPAAARILKDHDLDLRGRDVVVVEDVVDTGLTLSLLLRHLAASAPASLCALALLDRPYRRLVPELPLRWVGFTVPDELYAGYGFDLDERWRNLPDIHVLVPQG